jgi:5'-3' exonuclease
MELHLVDATYELFRAHHAPRPPVRGRDGMPLTAVAGLAGTLLALVRDEGATHVGCAHDRVIRSFRNDRWPGYKSEVGVPAELLAQFPVAEEAIRALGFVLWPMVEWEADDALATAAVRWADVPGVSRILVCTPDKDLAQVVRAGRVVLRDRRRDITYDEAGVRAKWGVPPSAIPDYLALVGDAADGFPGIAGFGSKGAAALLAAFGTLEGIRDAAIGAWPSSVRGAERMAATLYDRWPDALLFRDLATLRTRVPLDTAGPEALRWEGADPEAWPAFCERWGLPGLSGRPHRWRPAARAQAT